jgi:DNA primase small subunit
LIFETTNQFIQNKFAKFYSEYSDDIKPPRSIHEREFGFLLMKEKRWLRHKRFLNELSLQSFTQRVAPSDVYSSSAYYEDPEASMEDKGWRGADLVFDIDADHLTLPCSNTHDKWNCMKCGVSGLGSSLLNCPNCGNQSLKTIKWVCEFCLESAKSEVIKLLDILFNDFSFSQDEIQVFFSGNRGYHVHVESDSIYELDSNSRREIVDYLVGIGIESSYHNLVNIKTKRSRGISGPNLNDPGWRGRIAKGTYDFILTATKEDLKNIGVKKKAAQAIIKHRQSLLSSWDDHGPWDTIKDVGIESWRKITQHSVKNQSIRIDTVVTTDIHRLIRIANTLHGKTGLKKKKVPILDIESFDPFTSAIAFEKGVVEIYVIEAPKFRLNRTVFGPFKDELSRLPTAAAIYLLCKGIARLPEDG